MERRRRERRYAQWCGGQIRAARQAKGWTLEQLAAASGVSYNYISEIEHGTGGLLVDTLIPLADALGISWAALLDACRAQERHRQDEQSAALSLVTDVRTQGVRARTQAQHLRAEAAPLRARLQVAALAG